MIRIPVSIGQHFAFASGRTAVLRQSLLSASDIDRLLGTSGIKDFESALGEIKLAAETGVHSTGTDEAIRGIEQWMQAETDMLTPAAKRPIFAILWMAGDAPRLAYLLKKHHGLSSDVSAEPVSSLSAWSPEQLRSAVETGEGNVPESVLVFIREMRSLTKPDPKTIDRAVARFIAERRLSLARASGSPHILRFVRHQIDITNIRTALRLSRSGTDRASALLPGGFVDAEKLRGTASSISAVIAKSDLYAPFIGSDTKGGSDIERIGAEILAADIKHMWSIPLSIEPVFAFAAMVLSHARLLRSIAIGKRNGLSPQEIKRILPPFIPGSLFTA